MTSARAERPSIDTLQCVKLYILTSHESHDSDTIFTSLSSILMTRLMFNLRDFNSRRTGGRDVNQGVSDNDTELTDSTLWGHNQVSTGPSVYFLDDGV